MSGTSDGDSRDGLASRRGPRPTLAIVDDSDEVRTLVRARLELSELFEIVGEGADGNEAIGVAYRHEPDLMLLDTSMPGMDGLEALPAILTLSPETRVVMFTGFEERVLAERARELGAVDFVEKSLHIEDLPRRLWRALGTDEPAPRPRGRLWPVPSHHSDAPSQERDQAVLDEHLERFREVFDQAAIGMATLTLNGSIVRANAALATMMECEPADLVGIDYGQLMAGHGEDLDQALESIAAAGADLISLEHPLPTGEQTRTVRATLAPVRDSKSQPLYVFAQIQDISAQRFAEDELRRSEERFRLLVTAVGDYAIFMLDPEGQVISWNAGAQRIKGYAASEIVGRHFRVFYPPEEQESGHPEHNLELALRDGAYAEEGWRVRKDGTRFWASVVITAVYAEDGTHIGFAKVTRDQTEQRLREEQRREAVEQQTHLLAVTAHELRTPAAVIGGSSSMLLDHGDELGEQERTQLIAAISSSATRLQRLVSDLGTASRLQADAFRLHLEPVAMGPLVAAAVERFHGAHSGVELAVDLAPDLGRLDDPDGGPTLVADAGRLGQAIDNLLDNAARHGTPPVALSAWVDAEALHLSVSDQGAGVPVELEPRLFDRFAIAGPTGGTGLGLYLVREIARRHGGDVVYERPAGDRPAAFVLTLPLSAPA